MLKIISYMTGLKRILFVINDYDFFISHRYVLAKACLDKGWEVHIATPQKYEAAKKAKKRGMIWHSLLFDPGSYNPIKDFIFLKELIKLYKLVKPDLVHHVTIKVVLYGSIAARLTNIPAMVNALSGLGYLYINNSLKNKLVRLGVNRLFRWGFHHPNSQLILQNEDDKALILRYHLLKADSITIIRGSGVNTNLFFYKTEDKGPVRVVFPGRMLWDKGVGEFVEAANILKKKGVNATFHLVGNPDPKNPKSIFKKQLKQWNKEPHIFYEGYQSDMVIKLQWAHIVCLPSYREGLPKALLEAASVGRPIVTTDVPGCREVVEEGWNGYLVPVKNTALLADRLEKLINEADLRKKFGERGRQKIINEFAVDFIIAKTMQVYKELIQ